ncbi:hypothetical protein PoB_003026800 [Plakobranchus ocellatus]|uniref:Uncharacterized protein n=1 Tax=Plakobranchus ocellatus TaxID=259542 RepID=A0AAV4AAX2_9GAST|nr:hypothetical protein PoB_003026800 [Plakobranchus ocellatus]
MPSQTLSGIRTRDKASSKSQQRPSSSRSGNGNNDRATGPAYFDQAPLRSEIAADLLLSVSRWPLLSYLQTWIYPILQYPFTD